MTQQEKLQIFERDQTVSPRKLRSVGYIPGTVYGNEQTPASIQVKAYDLERALSRGVRSFELEGLGAPIQAKVKEMQLDPVKQKVLHIQFFVVGKRQASKPEKQEPKAQQKAEPEAAPPPVEEPKTEEQQAEPSAEAEEPATEEPVPVH